MNELDSDFGVKSDYFGHGKCSFLASFLWFRETKLADWEMRGREKKTRSDLFFFFTAVNLNWISWPTAISLSMRKSIKKCVFINFCSKQIVVSKRVTRYKYMHSFFFRPWSTLQLRELRVVFFLDSDYTDISMLAQKLITKNHAVLGLWWNFAWRTKWNGKEY